jgi:hypothetical protein
MSDALELALDELYATGWSALDSTGCQHHRDGRSYPGLVRTQRELAKAGYELRLNFVQLFDCYRAEWSDAQGKAVGAVVGSSEIEAAIYALAQLRRMTKAGAVP